MIGKNDMLNFKIQRFDYNYCSEYIICNTRKRVIASVTVEHFSEHKWIDALWVDKKYRKQGFATRLMKRALKDFNGFRFKLWCVPDEEDLKPIPFENLLSFYRSFGFVLDKESNDRSHLMLKRKIRGD